jgi:hypothetical protein
MAALDFYLASNLWPKETGLPFVVWISLRGELGPDACVWVSRSPKDLPSKMVTVAIQPDVRVVEGEMSATDLVSLRKWIELNRDVLVGHWDGDIESSVDALNAIRPITR